MKQKKHAFKNLFLAITILFVICFKSLHVFFSDHHQHKSNNKNKVETCKNFKQVVSEKEDCLVCHFEFAAFLQAHTFIFDVFCPQSKTPLFSKNYKTPFFQNNFICFFKRGPP